MTDFPSGSLFRRGECRDPEGHWPAWKEFRLYYAPAGWEGCPECMVLWRW